MLTKWLCFIYLLILSWQICCQEAGQKIVINQIANCPGKENENINFDLITTDEGKLAFNFKVDYDYDIDSSYKVMYRIESYKNNEWVKTHESKDAWCKFTQIFAQAWEKVKLEVKPPITNLNQCEITGVNYADSIPLINLSGVGKFRVEMRFYFDDDGSEEDILCVNAEYDIEE